MVKEERYTCMIARSFTQHVTKDVYKNKPTEYVVAKF